MLHVTDAKYIGDYKKKKFPIATIGNFFVKLRSLSLCYDVPCKILRG